jgi:aspartate--ammonia ligase
MQSIFVLQQQVAHAKHLFTQALCQRLQLIEVQAPLSLAVGSGMQDTLGGHEQPVSFRIRSTQQQHEVVHSLAKWKRAVLADYQATVGQGIVAQMRALRPDEDRLSERHSILVEQWDWEQVIAADERTIALLKQRVQAIYRAVLDSLVALGDPADLLPSLPQQVTFIDSETLRQQFPLLSPKQREREIVLKHKVVFIIGIGGQLADGSVHDGRAADYDDWSSPTELPGVGLNGDLLVWHERLDDALELSSMGIRVDRQALQRQSRLQGCLDSLEQPWHQRLLKGELPATIGGGIGQSRLIMWLLQCDHITQVQAPAAQEQIAQQSEVA